LIKAKLRGYINKKSMAFYFKCKPASAAKPNLAVGSIEFCPAVFGECNIRESLGSGDPTWGGYGHRVMIPLHQVIPF
jgi:hypothetical protein